MMNDLFERPLLPSLVLAAVVSLVLWLSMTSAREQAELDAVAAVEAEVAEGVKSWRQRRSKDEVASDAEAFVALHGISDLQKDPGLAARTLPGMMYYGEMLEQRRVSLDFTVPQQILIPAGRLPREGQERQDFTNEMARAFLEEECALLMETLAKHCLVMSVNTSEATGDIQMMGSLSFVAKNEVGDLSKIFESKMRYAEFKPGAKRLEQPTQDKLTAERRKIYAGILEACEELKKEVGNCAVSTVSIKHNKKSDGAMRVDGHGAFMALQSAPAM